MAMSTTRRASPRRCRADAPTRWARRSAFSRASRRSALAVESLRLRIAALGGRRVVRAEGAAGRSAPRWSRASPSAWSRRSSPWNAPLVIMADKVFHALRPGCTSCSSRRPQTPARRLHPRPRRPRRPACRPAWSTSCPPSAEAAEHLVTRPGRRQGQLHRLDRRRPADRRAVRRPHRAAVTLELGGKSAAIVRDDADLEAAVGRSAPPARSRTGQVCSAQTRIVVHARALRRGRRRPGEASPRSRSATRSTRRPTSARSSCRAPARPRRGYIAAGARTARGSSPGGGRPADLERGLVRRADGVRRRRQRHARSRARRSSARCVA